MHVDDHPLLIVLVLHLPELLLHLEYATRQHSVELPSVLLLSLLTLPPTLWDYLQFTHVELLQLYLYLPILLGITQEGLVTIVFDFILLIAIIPPLIIPRI
jgi:hypothetical protein